MSSSDWLSKHNLTYTKEITEIYWGGIRLPLQKAQAAILASLLENGAFWPPSSWDKKSTIVRISVIRGLLREVGFPLAIKFDYGNGCYVLMEAKAASELGVPEADRGDTNGRTHATSGGDNGLQGSLRRT